MYLHSRNTNGDFIRVIAENRSNFPGGVVHSFSGTTDEMIECCKLGLYIGINGCSMKTAE